MSATTSVPVASAPISLPLMVVGAAVIGAGALCCGIGKAMTSGCKEVYKMCKEGNYPADRLQMVHTPISNFTGLTTMLSSQGFIMSSLSNMAGPNDPSSTYSQKEAIDFTINQKMRIPSSDQRIAGTLDFTKERSFAAIKQEMAASNMNIFVASNTEGERIILMKSDEGIGLIGENVDLLQGKIQDFATQEIVSVLKDIDFKVKVEEKFNEKVITAANSQMDEIHISIEKGSETIRFDTHKTRRPKCDIIHQLIKDKLGEKKNANSSKQTNRWKERNEEINLKRKI